MEWEGVNVNWGFGSGYIRWGIKMEFGGFMGGFVKIFFTKGDKERFWGVFGMEREKGKRDREILGYVWEGM